MTNATVSTTSSLSRLDLPAPSLRDVEQFLYREARLLDERRFDEWANLFTEDGVYWVPTRHDQKSPDECVSIFYDTRDVMAARMRRLNHPDAHIQAPPSGTTHLVTNIELEPEAVTIAGASTDPVWRAHASFAMAEYRRGEPRWYAGRYEYQLVQSAPADLHADPASTLRIRLKKTVLVNCTASFTAMAVYI
jgi:3-phenylpropionate/cinnamic acid dioxygenase small subunit